MRVPFLLAQISGLYLYGATETRFAMWTVLQKACFSWLVSNFVVVGSTWPIMPAAHAGALRWGPMSSRSPSNGSGNSRRRSSTVLRPSCRPALLFQKSWKAMRHPFAGKPAQTDIYYLREMFGPVCETIRTNSLRRGTRKRPELEVLDQQDRRR